MLAVEKVVPYPPLYEGQGTGAELLLFLLAILKVGGGGSVASSFD